MTEPSVTHATIVLERVYDASPGRVFQALADPRARARWGRHRRVSSWSTTRPTSVLAGWMSAAAVRAEA
ncbi:hypothetical protein ACVDG5_023830 [Mesorhizobium sp. ORM6]